MCQRADLHWTWQRYFSFPGIDDCFRVTASPDAPSFTCYDSIHAHSLLSVNPEMDLACSPSAGVSTKMLAFEHKATVDCGMLFLHIASHIMYSSAYIRPTVKDLFVASKH